MAATYPEPYILPIVPYASTLRECLRQLFCCDRYRISHAAYAYWRVLGLRAQRRPAIDRTYAVAARTRSIACGSEVPSIFYASFFARRGEKRRVKEKKYHSAEGSNADCASRAIDRDAHVCYNPGPICCTRCM